MERASQRGFAALFVTLILFFAASLALLYANRGAVVEQRLSGNEVRAKQAFAAANAGIDHALTYMRHGGIDQNTDGAADTIASVALTNGGGQSSRYKVWYCDSAANPPACPVQSSGTLACTAPSSFAQVQAVACGWSDDDTSVQRVVQALQGTQSTPGSVAAPLISRGTANLLTGGASIFNYFNDLTVWSGGSMAAQSNTGKTFIRDTGAFPNADTAQDSNNDGTPDYRDTGNSPGCNNAPTGYQCSTQGSNLGHDTIVSDLTLSSSSLDQYFQRFFGKDPTEYRDTVATYTVDLSGGTLPSANSTSITSIQNMREQVIWVEGNVTGSLPTPIGAPDHPVILIVNGDLTLGSNTEIYGQVYVAGTLYSNGTPTIVGALMVAGDANTTGNLKIVYDPVAVSNTHNIGQAARVPGGFRDW